MQNNLLWLHLAKQKFNLIYFFFFKSMKTAIIGPRAPLSKFRLTQSLLIVDSMHLGAVIGFLLVVSVNLPSQIYHLNGQIGWNCGGQLSDRLSGASRTPRCGASTILVNTTFCFLKVFIKSCINSNKQGKGDTAAVSGSWKLPLPAPATTVAKNQCLTCCLTCCFWCWISHWVLLILSWNMWLRGRSGGLWLGRDPGGVGGSVKIGDWVFDLVGVFPWLRSFGLTFRLVVLREYSYLGVYLSAVTIWSMPFVLVSCC